jgi:hypothetical protein
MSPEAAVSTWTVTQLLSSPRPRALYSAANAVRSGPFSDEAATVSSSHRPRAVTGALVARGVGRAAASAGHEPGTTMIATPATPAATRARPLRATSTPSTTSTGQHSLQGRLLKQW